MLRGLNKFQFARPATPALDPFLPVANDSFGEINIMDELSSALWSIMLIQSPILAKRQLRFSPMEVLAAG